MWYVIGILGATVLLESFIIWYGLKFGFISRGRTIRIKDVDHDGM